MHSSFDGASHIPCGVGCDAKLGYSTEFFGDTHVYSLLTQTIVLLMMDPVIHPDIRRKMWKWHTFFIAACVVCMYMNRSWKWRTTACVGKLRWPWFPFYFKNPSSHTHPRLVSIGHRYTTYVNTVPIWPYARLVDVQMGLGTVRRNDIFETQSP